MKTFQGKVVSTMMSKTIVVEVERQKLYPLYKKIVSRSKRFKVHNEDSSIKTNDNVVIQETKPYSKDKHFKVLKKI